LPAALRASADTSFMVGKLIIVAFLVVILYNLGAGLYYMMVDKGTTNRTVKALTRRIALSVGLILIVMFSIWMGWITPHDLGR
jgi:succinate dehydrogenase/fumarate reductase cytochrome b subunit